MLKHSRNEFPETKPNRSLRPGRFKPDYLLAFGALEGNLSFINNLRSK
jgi:hypothetical protein